MARKIAVVDGCLDTLEIALLTSDGTQCVAYQKIIQQQNLSDLLVPTFEQVVENQPLAAIYVTNGPGSFTSVKLTVLFVNTYQFVHPTCNLYVLPTTRWHLTEGFTAVAIDAKSQLYYFQTKTMAAPSLISQSELLEKQKQMAVYVYNYTTQADFLTRWTTNRADFKSVHAPVQPLYLKEPV